MAALLGGYHWRQLGIGSELRRPWGSRSWAASSAARSSPCTRRRSSTSRSIAWASDSHEHFGPVHRAARRHDPPDRGHRARRRRRLHPAARVAAAAGGVSDHQRLRRAAGGEPGDHGVLVATRWRGSSGASRGHRETSTARSALRDHMQFDLTNIEPRRAHGLNAARGSLRNLPTTLLPQSNPPTHRFCCSPSLDVVSGPSTTSLVDLQQKLAQVGGRRAGRGGGRRLAGRAGGVSPTALARTASARDVAPHWPREVNGRKATGDEQRSCRWPAPLNYQARGKPLAQLPQRRRLAPGHVERATTP